MDLIFENLDIQSVDFLHSAPSLEQMVASTTEAAAEKQAVAGGLSLGEESGRPFLELSFQEKSLSNTYG